jgi:chorismate synthase
MLRFLTAGESHGKGLTIILEGIPANLSLGVEDINLELKRRQKGYGRGGRMKIETDSAQIISGVRFGKTLGSPISILIENKDWPNWQGIMEVENLITADYEKITNLRPGHADFAGAIKYHQNDLRNILERASARETAARVAAGAIAKKFLKEFKTKIISYVLSIGALKSSLKSFNYEALFLQAEKSLLRCPDASIEKKIMQLIDKTQKDGDTLGGTFEIIGLNLPIGLGSYIQWDKRLDGRLAQALMSIPAVKGVEIGLGFKTAELLGSKAHDEIYYKNGFYRKTNGAGGLEGGITNGMPLVLRAAMKPIATLRKALRSVNLITKKSVSGHFERADICAVPAASVIGEAVVSMEIANSFLEKFGGDSIEETMLNYHSYLQLKL